MTTQEQYENWKAGYNDAIKAAIHELRTPLQKLVDAVESDDQEAIKDGLRAAKWGLSIYDPES